MSFDPISLNLARYRTLSVLTVTGTMSVGNSLFINRLPELPDFVENSAQKLGKRVAEGQDALTERLDRKADLGLERAFDLLVDRIWALLKARMEFWQCYTHQGISLLSAEEQDKAEVDKNRKLAAVATELLERLFGGGTEFLRMPYTQQASHMAARLNYIHSRGLSAEFVEIVGVRPAALVEICQRRYEAMVADRTARNDSVVVDLRPHRARVKHAAENYASLLLSTLDDGDADWAKAVLESLRPMLAVERPNSSGNVEDEPELEIPEIDGEIVELLGGEQPPLLEGEGEGE